MAELLTHSPLNDEQAQAVRTIVDSGQSLLGLIDDILDFSKIEAGCMELDVAEFAVTPLVERVCATLLPMAFERGVQLTAWVDASVPEFLTGDALRVQQVFNNLVANAVKFSARSDGLPGRVAVRLEADREELRLSVSDNGIGMQPETLARLFKPFTQAEASISRRFGGTGLGLAICRRLVEMMEGRIEVQSKLGVGSTFTVTLPLRAGAVQAIAAQPVLAGLLCVLVSTDGLPMAQLRQWLEGAGAEVLAAGSLDAALEDAARCDDGDAAVVVHAQADAALALSAVPGSGVHQLVVGYGRREMLRAIAPTVYEIDLLRREPFLTGVAVAAGRLTPDSIDLRTSELNDKWTLPTLDQSRVAGEPILVVEDDATSRAVIRRQLAVLGHAAEFAHDGHQALSALQSGNYALLLTDLHMPELNGYALSGAIRLLEARTGRSRLPIVALTANAMKGEAAHAHTVGIDAYLTKPVPLAKLQATLNAWMPKAMAAAPHGEVGAEVGAGAVQPGDGLEPAPQVLDLQVLRDLTGAEETVLHDLLADFAASARRHVADLQRALRASDARAVSAMAHKLKSASRSVGAMALGDACAALERAGLEADASLQSHRARFDAAFRNVLQRLDVPPDAIWN